ncbi:amidohydrolase 2 domain protein [Mycobacterium xenopi 4042]|uniref:Amidohydrolase 2 domain protein n=1 Tax=Mycobacterium xenopi 4042 TaxID=1299334 RepID=X8DB58_MYCXE|nr:amidohydrolase 2 domain protein [Mycobacterium xenopi 4042]
MGLNAVVGRPPEEWSMEPARFDEMRRGCWDIKARIADMDLAGIWASLNFPSLIAGFSGTVFWKSKDPELGWRCCGRGTTGIWRSGPAASRADHPAAAAVAGRPAAGRRRGAPQR